MNKDDKQFFTDLMDECDQKWDIRLNQIKDELGQQIRNNGIRLERMQDDISGLAEEVQGFNIKLSDVKSDVAEIKENTCDLHIIRKLVKQHERQLSKIR